MCLGLASRRPSRLNEPTSTTNQRPGLSLATSPTTKSYVSDVCFCYVWTYGQRICGIYTYMTGLCMFSSIFYRMLAGCTRVTIIRLCRWAIWRVSWRHVRIKGHVASVFLTFTRPLSSEYHLLRQFHLYCAKTQFIPPNNPLRPSPFRQFFHLRCPAARPYNSCGGKQTT